VELALKNVFRTITSCADWPRWLISASFIRWWGLITAIPVHPQWTQWWCSRWLSILSKARRRFGETPYVKWW